MTSNVYQRTALQIIERALRLIRVIDPDTPLEPRERLNGLDALNGMVKYLQTKGFNLWRETEAFLILEQGKTKYLLGPGGDRCVNVDNFVRTTLAADALAGAINLTLASDTGIAGAPLILAFNPALGSADWTTSNAALTVDLTGLTVTNTDNLQGSASYQLDTEVGKTYRLVYGYELGTSSAANITVSDIQGTLVSESQSVSGTYSIEFTARQLVTTFTFTNADAVINLNSKVTSVNYLDMDSGDQIGIFLDTGAPFWTTVVQISPLEIRAPLPSNAASGNDVFSYDVVIPRPLSVIQTRYRDTIDGQDIPTTQWTRDRYFDQPDKTSQGTVTKWYYSPQLVAGELYVWQPASQQNSILPITFIRPLMVYENNVDAPDFPSEWFDLLSFGTAYRLMAEYKVVREIKEDILLQWDEILDSALGFDNDSDIQIRIDYEGRG